MTETMGDLLRSDAELTALAHRTMTATEDPALALLAAWAADLDSHDVHDVEVDFEPGPAPRRRRTVATRAVVLTVALTISSSGVAAAVNGNPLAPLTYVVTKIKAIGDRDDPGSSFLGAPGRDRADPSPRPDKSRDGSARDEPSRGQRRDRQPPAASLPTSAPPIVGELAPSATGNSGHDTEPSDVIAIPQQNPPHQPKPQSDVDPKPPEPLRLPTPDTPPNPHGPDLPSPEKPGTEPPTDPPPPDTPS